jgi:putative FmdB family regulatory protein
MPIYEYKCTKCEKIFELFQKMNDEPLKKCDCGGKVMRVFHPPGIVFKGSGFYTTDYKNKETTKTTAKTTKAPESKKPDKTEKKTQDKPKTEKVRK